MTGTVPKGYKQTEVGVIPEEWVVAELGTTCTQVTTGKLDVNAMTPNGQYNFYTCARDYYQIDTYAFDTEALLVSGNGANVGYIHYYKGKFNAYQRTYVLSGFVDSIKYVQHYMGRNLSERIRVEVNAGNTPYITRGTLTEMKIALPPTKAEQEAIAEALSDVDALIASLDKLIAKKRDLKQAAMQELLTGKKRLPGFSGEWEVKRLGDCLISRPDYGINAPAVPFSDRLPAYIRITDISEDSRFSPEKLVSVRAANAGNYYLSDGDLVFARTGASVGKSYLYNPLDGRLVFAGFLIRVRPDPAILIPAFLAAYATTDAYWNWVRLMSMRSGQPGINGNEYAQLPISLPSIPEQTAIAAVLSDMDAGIAAVERKRDKTRALKQGMMQELLTGKTRLV